MNTLFIALGTLVAAIAFLAYKLFVLEKEVKVLKKQQQQQHQKQGEGSCERNLFGQGVFHHPHLSEEDHHPLMMMPHMGPGFQAADGGGDERGCPVQVMQQLMMEGSRRAVDQEEEDKEDEELTSYLPMEISAPPPAEPSSSSIGLRDVIPEEVRSVNDERETQNDEKPNHNAPSAASEPEPASKEPVESVPSSQPPAPEAEQQPVSVTRKRRVKASSPSTSSSS